MQKTHHQSPSGRKALQPKNNNINSPITPNNIKQILPPPSIQQQQHNNNNNENIPPIFNYPNTSVAVIIEDASLADELAIIRLKLDRLRIDKEETEKMLKDRDVMLDLKMKEIIKSGDVQKQLEIEVDRLYRLNQIRLSCLRISPIRTLRDKEHEKKIKQDQLKANIITQERGRDCCDNEESPKLEEEARSDN